MNTSLRKVFPIFLLLFILSFSSETDAQVTNDECQSAIHLTDLFDYCSPDGGFTTVGATPSAGVAQASCWPEVGNDVWFSFYASTPAIYLQIAGNTVQAPGGTLRLPSIALYRGSCTSGLTQVLCASDGVGQNTLEQIGTNLTIGALYYIRVSARAGNTGTFQLCLNAFISAPEPSSDCPTAVILCDKSPFVVEQLSGVGNITDEADDSCLDIDPNTGIDDGNSEKSSVWYHWTCEQAGTLTFNLSPNGPDVSEDLDFALYELPNGVNDCSGKILIRCMASGENVGQPFSQWERCTGATGLREGETDVREERGCAAGDNNFLAPLDMEAGKSYALIVNNFSQTGRGFDIDFGGTGTFLGPKPDFDLEAVQAFECDKTIIYTNLSDSETDSIVSLQWNFGAGATPATVNGDGPHDVIYESFGDKIAALTVTSSRGCVVTKLIDLYVEPCCMDTSTLDLDAAVVDLICQDVPTGEIEAFGISGAPAYNFSLNGSNFGPASLFGGLPSGEFTLYVEDQKGCRDSIELNIENAPPFTVDAGDVIDVNLGDSVLLNAIPNPPIISGVTWNPPGSLTFTTDSLSPMALPPGTTTYTVQVMNDAGCVAEDDVLVRVNIVRPVYIPNAMSANGDGVNDRFTVYSGSAADRVEQLLIFNRWGALIFESSNFATNDESAGWDGRFKGQFVEPGVFAYIAKVHFVDNVVLTYSGSLTVVR